VIRTGFKTPKPPRKPQPSYVLARAFTTGPVARVPVVRVKEPEGKNQHLRDMARGMPCLLQSPICNHDSDTVVACHGSGIENGKGMGRKVSDALTVHGCSACNDYTDAFYRATKAEKKAVFDAGHKRQVELWRIIAADPKESIADRMAAQWALDQLARPKVESK